MFDFMKYLKVNWRCEQTRKREGFPAGHFYSPIPDYDDLNARADSIFGNRDVVLAGIDLNVPGQLATFELMARHIGGIPFGETPSTANTRYHFQNDFFGYGDVSVLWCLLNHLKPSNVVEVGSGYSSAAFLDARELIPLSSTHLTFIEPYTERLDGIMRGDEEGVTIQRSRLQEADLRCIQSLQKNDILFIDSSHVGKTGSDVNLLFFNILPSLKPGVWVHIHDVFFPFEYPRDWVLNERRAWNEAYMLHCFLCHNSSFQIEFWNDYFWKTFPELLRKNMPLSMRNAGGSIWLSKK